MKPAKIRRTQIALAVGAIMSGVAFSQSAAAACTVDGETYTVNTNLDEISMTPDVVTLRQAILDANVDPATCDLINFAESMNGQTIMLDLVANSGELDINGHVNIVGPGSDQLTIKTSGAGSYQRALNFESGDISVSGITFDGEETSSSAGIYGYPFDDTSLMLDDIVVKNVFENEGLYFYGGSATSSSLTITNSRFENNAETGVFAEDLDSISISDSSFTDNDGTGLSIEGDSATIDNVSSDANTRGIYVSMSTMGSVTISNSSVTNNTTSGGIYLATGVDGDATIDNVTVDGNINEGSGGGIRIGRGGAIIIRNSTISNNTANNFGSGGGIDLNTSSADMQVIIEQSTISGNTAAERGGGVAMQEYIDPSSQPQIIRNSTITDNVASFGGGVYANNFAFDIDISNTIIADNSATGSDAEILVADDNPGNPITISHSFIGSSDGMGFINDNSILNGGDPMLAALGMPVLGNAQTEVHEPEMGSPVIDMGDPALVAGTGNTPTLDQIGRTRVANSRIDIGSVEYNANVAPTLDVAITEGTAEVGVEFELDLDDFFSDANGDTITYSITNAADVPAAIMITGSMLSATFIEADIGTYTVEYQACDNEPLCATGSGVLNVEAASEEESSGGGGGAFGAGTLIFLMGLLPVWMRRKP